MKIKFTISSRKLGFEQTYPIIIKSLIENNVPPQDIYFFVGGYDSITQSITDEGVNLIQVNQNSIDYTGLIGVLDLDIVSDYWVLLHDTCYVGPNFYNHIMSYNYNYTPAVGLIFEECCMNIGAYSWEYLQKIKSNLLEYRNTDFSEESIQKWKTIGIVDEDKFLSEYNVENHYCVSSRIHSGPVDIYNTGTPRLVEYFPGIDLYKLKANWYRREIYELSV